MTPLLCRRSREQTPLIIGRRSKAAQVQPRSTREILQTWGISSVAETAFHVTDVDEDEAL